MVQGLRERKKTATRRAISDTATRLFMTDGFDNTTVADVAEAVGVSAQTVTNYFPAKTDLFFDDQHWVAGPAAAVRQHCPRLSAAAAVLAWYTDTLRRRHHEQHLAGLGQFLRTIQDSVQLRQRQLADIAEMSTQLCRAITAERPGSRRWEAELLATCLTGAYTVCESEIATLAGNTEQDVLLATAQKLAADIFGRIDLLE
jgi:AcrR family transcriptional regulator